MILVMGSGSVREFGPPQQLLRKGGEFAALLEAHHAQMRQQALTSTD
jgi:ABC-type multidrug transport system fused ATPase/permease subunit